MTTISADTALDMALAATKALREEINNHEETKRHQGSEQGVDKLRGMNSSQRTTIVDLQEDVKALQRTLDETVTMLDNAEKRVEMRELTLRQTVNRNKELREQLEAAALRAVDD